MRWWSRLAVVMAGGLMLAKAHTTWPWLVPVALVPLVVSLLAPVEEVGGGRRPLRWGEAVLWGMFCYLFSGLQVWPAAQYGGLIFAAGLVYMALGGGLFGALVWPILGSPRRGERVWGVVLAWVLADATRTMTPWSYPMVLGGNLAFEPALAQLASVGGLWLLDGVVAWMSAWVAEGLWAWSEGSRREGARWVLGGAGVFVGVLLFGVVRLAWLAPGAAEWSPGVEATAPPSARTFALVQGGHPNWLFARATVLSRLDEVVRAGTLELLDAGLAARPWGRPVDFAVTAENALGQVLEGGEGGLESAGILGRRPGEGTVLIVGATRYVDSERAMASGARFENVALALEPVEGGRLGVVDAVYKRQLVPFAESLYWRDPGRYRGLATSKGRLGVLICYESIYPGVTEALVEDGVGPLLVVTNDAGLRRSYVAEIHARLGIVRAIESGRGLVHAGQAGLTFFADAGGRRTRGLGLFERGVLYGGVTEEVVWTPYAWSGRWCWLGGALLGWAALVAKVRWRMKAKRVA